MSESNGREAFYTERFVVEDRSRSASRPAWLLEGPSPARRKATKGLFLLLAGGAAALSLGLWVLVGHETGLYVGLSVPTLLSLGALLLAGRREG